MKKLLLAAAFVAFSMPAVAAPVCATIESNRAEAATLGVPAENIVVVDDIMFINDYTKALGLPIPDDSQSKSVRCHYYILAVDVHYYFTLVHLCNKHDDQRRASNILLSQNICSYCLFNSTVL